MGYFSNGTEGYLYEEEWCSRCVHQESEDGTGCPVWLAHLLHSYRDCNDPDSILHLLIPLSDDVGNEQCRMFWPSGKPDPRAAVGDLFDD